MKEVQELEDIIGETSMLDGKKMSIKDIFDIPLIFTGWKIRASKFEHHGDLEGDEEIGRYVILQFLLNGKRHVVFTSSSTIIRQIEALQEIPNFPHRFKGVIKKKNKFYKICRTTN